MLPEHFYFTGAGWLGYFIYVPVALLMTGLIYWFLLRKISQLIIRWSVMIVLSLALFTWPLWGALAISYKAEKLCKEQGGLHVYKVVETDSLLGPASTKRWVEYGFSYIERSGPNNKKYRFTLKDGKEIGEEIPEYTSRYISRGDKLERIDKYFARMRYYVEDQYTQDILGELVTIIIYPSRFDLFVLGLLPVEYNPWHCGDEAPKGEGSYSPGEKKYLYSYADVVKATLKPKISARGEGK